MQRLAPSLVSHNGCTIIDINPGAGLWSSKLHEHLKPQSHILVEPYKNLYLPWLKPLLEAPDSRYHLREWDDPACWDPAPYMSEGLLPKDLGTAGATTNCNSSILIVANMADRSKRKGGNSPELKKRIVHLAHQMQCKMGFHAYGPVRLLMWMPGSLRNSALPATVAYRKRFSLRLEMVCHVEEIIRGTDGMREKEKRRPDFLDIASSIQVLRKMKKYNIHISRSRQDVIHKLAREVLKDSDGAALDDMKDPLGRITTMRSPWQRELEQLEENFRDGKFGRFSDESADTKSQSPEYARMIGLRKNWRHNQKNKLILEDLFREQDVIDSLERDACNGELDALEREVKMKEFTCSKERFNTRLEQMSDRIKMLYKHQRDDRRAFFQDPPVLMWDRRIAEPVVAHENEIHPSIPFSLLDFQPHSPDLYPLTKEQVKQGNQILTALFDSPDRGLAALDIAAPGAYNAIVPKVPDLRDPLRGGRQDASLMQAHMLTREMVYGIYKAWDEWPSRPSLAEMVL